MITCSSLAVLLNCKHLSIFTECTSQFCSSKQGLISYPNEKQLWIIAQEPQEQTTITLFLKDIVVSNVFALMTCIFQHH